MPATKKVTFTSHITKFAGYPGEGKETKCVCRISGESQKRNTRLKEGYSLQLRWMVVETCYCRTVVERVTRNVLVGFIIPEATNWDVSDTVNVSRKYCMSGNFSAEKRTERARMLNYSFCSRWFTLWSTGRGSTGKPIPTTVRTETVLHVKTFCAVIPFH